MKKKDRRRLWFALRRYILFFALMYDTVPQYAVGIHGDRIYPGAH